MPGLRRIWNEAAVTGTDTRSPLASDAHEGERHQREANVQPRERQAAEVDASWAEAISCGSSGFMMRSMADQNVRLIG